MAIAKNKERISVSLDKKLISRLRENAETNNSTPSKELANILRQYFCIEQMYQS